MPDAKVLLILALGSILFVGAHTTVNATKNHVVKPVAHFIHRIVKHETKP